MKKILFTLVFTSALLSATAQISGKGLNIGLTYSMPARTQFDKYMDAISSALGINQSLVAKKDIGLSAGFSFRTDGTEIEAGAGLMLGHKTKINSAGGSVSAALNTKTFDIHFGFNKYLAGPFFIGSDFGVIAKEGKFETVGMESLFESTPSSSNPFKGYSFAVKPKAGFFFPFSKKEYSGIRVNAFYYLGLSKYEFYKNDIFPTRLKNYTGDTKSGFNAPGVQLSLIVSMSN